MKAPSRYVVLTGLGLGGDYDLRFCSSESGANAWLSHEAEGASTARCRVCKRQHEVIALDRAVLLGLLDPNEDAVAINLDALLAVIAEYGTERIKVQS